MKVSIISITKDNGRRLNRTFDSVYDQRLRGDITIEHIIVDGGNPPEGNEAIARAVARGSKLIVAEPRGCYNAINVGIAAATGDIIGLVHGNDAFATPQIVARAADEFAADADLDFVYGDIKYDVATPGLSYSQYYSGAGFLPEHLLEGFAPPHPSMFIRRSTMNEVGPYKEDYLTAADFDLFLRLFHGSCTYKWKYLPGAAVLMQRDGASTRLSSRLWINTAEKRRALRENGFSAGAFTMLRRYFKHFDFFKKVQK